MTFEGNDIGILWCRTRARFLNFGALIPRPLDQALGLAHVESPLHHLAGKPGRVPGVEERAGVARGQRPVLKHVLDRVGQVQKANHIGDMAAALAHGPGEFFLTVVEFLQQPVVAARLLERTEVPALDILDQGDLQGVPVRKLLDDDRNIVKLGRLRRPPAAFTGDDFVGVGLLRMVTHDDRLEDALRPHRFDKRLHVLLGEIPARLQAAGMKELHRHHTRLAQPLEACLFLACLAKKRGQTAPEILLTTLGPRVLQFHSEISRSRRSTSDAR